MKGRATSLLSIARSRFMAVAATLVLITNVASFGVLEQPPEHLTGRTDRAVPEIDKFRGYSRDTDHRRLDWPHVDDDKRLSDHRRPASPALRNGSTPACDPRWRPGTPVNGVGGTIEDIAVDATGNVYVGGAFAAAGSRSTRPIR